MRKMLIVVAIVFALALGLYAAEPDPGFGGPESVAPTTPAQTADKCRPDRFIIDGRAKTCEVFYSRGSGEAAAYAVHARGNFTIRNERDAEGQPDPAKQHYAEFVSGKQLGNWVKAQPQTPTNGAVFRKLLSWLLAQWGVTEVAP